VRDDGGTASQSPGSDLDLGPGPERGPSGMVAARRRAHALLERQSQLAERIKSGTAGSTWSRLNALDFMNSSMQFAALGVLCLFPFLIVVSAGTGHDLRKTVVTRTGLDTNAAKDVRHHPERRCRRTDQGIFHNVRHRHSVFRGSRLSDRGSTPGAPVSRSEM
jgi:hypothetical protein